MKLPDARADVLAAMAGGRLATADRDELAGVLEKLTQEMLPVTMKINPVTRSKRVVGKLLDWLEEQPGDSWQERWDLWIARGEQDSLVDSLATAVGRIAAAFTPRPVVYRASDFRTNEFRNLQGGQKYEPEEHNPMIGYRGCYRYVSNPDLFALELTALARVREQNPNLHLMIPFVRTKWELEKCLELVDASPLGRQRGLHRWVMAEVPSVVYWLPEYVGMGIDGVSIGSNDLTQLMLGVDRDSDLCAELYDESDAAVLDAIGQIITTARRQGITASLCGQAPSSRPDFAEHLVQLCHLCRVGFPIQGLHLIAVLGGFAGEKFASREREEVCGDGVALLERNLLISFRPSDFGSGPRQKLFAVA